MCNENKKERMESGRGLLVSFKKGTGECEEKRTVKSAWIDFMLSRMALNCTLSSRNWVSKT